MVAEYLKEQDASNGDTDQKETNKYRASLEECSNQASTASRNIENEKQEAKVTRLLALVDTPELWEIRSFHKPGC